MSCTRFLALPKPPHIRLLEEGMTSKEEFWALQRIVGNHGHIIEALKVGVIEKYVLIRHGLIYLLSSLYRLKPQVGRECTAEGSMQHRTQIW